MERYNCIGIIIQPLYRNVIFEGDNFKHDESTKDISGRLEDVWGPSLIKGKLDLYGGLFEFDKNYIGRPPISYTFKNENGLWVGEWNGSDSLDGEALCELFKSGEKPRYDWREISSRATMSQIGAEKWGKNFARELEKRGYVKRIKDPETGEDMVQFTDKGKKLDDDSCPF